MPSSDAVVIAGIIGGLGNQMFQYAAGRALARRLGTDFRIDVSAFETYSLHVFSLSHLAVEAPTATAEDVDRISQAHRRNPLARAAWRVPALRRYCRNLMLYERHFHFDSSVSRVRGNVYMQGNWQSPRYFEGAEELIRREFRIRTAPDAANAEIGERIRNTESVCVHVRRGDYVSNEVTRSIHGTCGPEYYDAAIAYLRSLGVRPSAFVFSDDPAWARANLRLGVPTTFVAQNDPSRNYEDLRLMTECAHHVIANSSFSWWGAWLATRPGKRVIAPRRWFADQRVRTDDLTPPDWVRL